MSYRIPELLENRISISNVREFYTQRGAFSGYGVELVLSELRLRKTLKSKDRRFLSTKIDDTLHTWGEKYQRHLDKKHKEQRAEHVDQLNREVQETSEGLNSILAHTLDINDAVAWSRLERKDEFPTKPEFRIDLSGGGDFLIFDNNGKPTGFKETRPPLKPAFQNFKRRYGLFSRVFREDAIHQDYKQALQKWQAMVEKTEAKNIQKQNVFKQACSAFRSAFNQHLKEYEKEKKEFEEKKTRENNALEDFKSNYTKHEKGAVEEYCDLVLNNSFYSDIFPKTWELEYREDSRIVVVDYDLPPPENIPDTDSFKYIKSRDEVIEKKRAISTQKKIYDSVMYQICIRTIHELFEADVENAIDGVGFNGLVTTTNAATGKIETKTIISVSANKEAFEQFDLSKVDPKGTFKHLKGVAAASLIGLTPIAPVIQIERNDRRIVEGREVVHGLDSSVNLAAMDWQEFEHLIREIFEKEFAYNGGEVNVTRGSSDGGVDAIAFDPDPIRGGKIVIQAKCYTNVVGVANVRELWGTVMNEGAIKGILVTTSHYGKDAYEFAKGKPLSLLDGSNLLSMLEKHGHSARIDLAEAKKLLKE